MGDIIETIKIEPDIQNEISQIFDKNNKESFSTRSQISQNALIQIKVFKQAINFIG